jgi:uracil-DNA glycosylase
LHIVLFCWQSQGQKLFIIGQTPGLKVQQSGKPCDDASGKIA